MCIGDLVYLRPKMHEVEEDFIGLLVNKQYIGTEKANTTLYDVLLSESSEILTVSDIYFEIWRIE